MSHKILVVEDDKDVRKNIELLLTGNGYEVSTASNGKEGFKQAMTDKPDLILCDIMMPEMDGYELLNHLSNYATTRNIPFLFLTAKVERDDLRKGMELGADDYIFKPFRAAELIRAIETRLNKFQKIKADILDEADVEFKSEDKKLDKKEYIFLSVNKSSKFVKINDIKFITAENQYTNLGMSDGTQFLIRRPLSSWEEHLPEDIFLRIHRSNIINLNYITKVEKWVNNAFRVYIDKVPEPFIISNRYAKKIKNAF